MAKYLVWYTTADTRNWDTGDGVRRSMYAQPCEDGVIEPVDSLVQELHREGKSCGDGTVRISSVFGRLTYDYPAPYIVRYRNPNLTYSDGKFYFSDYTFRTYDALDQYDSQGRLSDMRRHYFLCPEHLKDTGKQFLWFFHAWTFGSSANVVRCTFEVRYPDFKANVLLRIFPFGYQQWDVSIPGKNTAERRKNAKHIMLQEQSYCWAYARWSYTYYSGKVQSRDRLYFLPYVDFGVLGTFDYKYSENMFIEKWNLFTFDQGGPLMMGMGAALLDAVDNVPALAMNNIANIIEAIKVAKELIQLILAACKGSATVVQKEGADLLKEIWLAYRYQWSTTYSDIVETAEYFDRLCDALNKEAVMARGFYSEDDIVYRASFSCPASAVIPPEIKSLQDLLHLDDYWMRTFGIALTPANVWDMVPFSFMVDWFLNLGDILGKLDTRSRAFDIPISKVWYSVTTSYINSQGVEERHYVRVVGPKYTGLPIWSHSLSNKGTTWVKRLGDTLSIFG